MDAVSCVGVAGITDLQEVLKWIGMFASCCFNIASWYLNLKMLFFFGLLRKVVLAPCIHHSIKMHTFLDVAVCSWHETFSFKMSLPAIIDQFHFFQPLASFLNIISTSCSPNSCWNTYTFYLTNPALGAIGEADHFQQLNAPLFPYPQDPLSLLFHFPSSTFPGCFSLCHSQWRAGEDTAKKKGCFDSIWLPRLHTSSATLNTVETHCLLYISNSD